MTVTLDRPWLEMDLGADLRVLSWSLNNPGFVTARHILWREVRDADLPRDFDVDGWFRRELAARDRAQAVGLLTSRNIDAFDLAEHTADGIHARAVATVGFSNAERIGTRLDRGDKDWGTINVAVQVDTGLTDAALIETLSIATQARTAAVMDAGYDLPTGRATGTGTDCIAVAAPEGDVAFAGLHTAVGEAVGAAVFEAVSRGARVWMDTVRREGEF
jgi:adenosylcobinamide amidohydrolase